MTEAKGLIKDLWRLSQYCDPDDLKRLKDYCDSRYSELWS